MHTDRQQPFEIGDTVILKSGGPAMTINEFNNCDYTIECVWFDEQKKLCREPFDCDSLIKVDDIKLHEPLPYNAYLVLSIIAFVGLILTTIYFIIEQKK